MIPIRFAVSHDDDYLYSYLSDWKQDGHEKWSTNIWAEGMAPSSLSLLLAKLLGGIYLLASYETLPRMSEGAHATKKLIVSRK
jgi:hypothetical protein